MPNTSPTAASSGSDLNGMAALNAAEQIKARMTEVAAEHFAVPAGEIVFSANRVYAGNRSISFRASSPRCRGSKRVSLSATGYYRTPKIHWDFATNTGRPFYYFAYGAAAAEVAIDTLTGENRACCAPSCCRTAATRSIRRSTSARSRARSCRAWAGSPPRSCGGTPTGRLRTHGPSTYKIPGSRDVPPVFNARILADAPNREATIFRSKAVGEPPLMLAISVFLAIRDAIASLADDRVPPRSTRRRRRSACWRRSTRCAGREVDDRTHSPSHRADRPPPARRSWWRRADR